MKELEELREQIKEFKTKTEMPYSFLAKRIGISKQSFYNFMSGSKGLSEERQKLVKEEIRRFE